MKFYHVSMDLKLGIKNFVPRIPVYRCKDEDEKTKRICACKSIEEAVSAFPYKGVLVNESLRKKKSSYLSVYEFESDNYLGHEDIIDRVPDAHLTKECWILESFQAKPHIIKIINIELSCYNKYICEYSGNVKTLKYEMDIVDYDREEEFILISKKALNQFYNLSRQNGITLEVIEDESIHYRHYYNGITTKAYRWIKVKLFIPSGCSLAPLWIEDDKQNNFAIRKRMILRKG